jgi:outer membrane lipoprotein carrier protein
MLIRFVAIATLYLLLTPLSRAASDAAFDRWLSWGGLTADFTQSEYDTNGALIRTSEGDVTLQRPSYALWRVRTPDPQEFYANAYGVWHYDPWLEVATFHSTEQAGNQATLALFSGNKSVLEQRYLVTEADDQLLFTPRENGGQIESVLLTLTNEGYPRRIELRTNLGHRSIVELTNAKIGEFPAEVFEFSAPPGTEIQ